MRDLVMLNLPGERWAHMSEAEVEIQVHPVAGQTLESVEADLPGFVAEAAASDGVGALVDSGELAVAVKDRFPTDQAVIILLTLASQAAIEYYKYYLKRKLQNEYDIVILAEPKGKDRDE